MQKIKFFSLGGLGEYGKNMYVISIDNNYFIIDSGLKYPNNALFGIDCIIPDYSILKKIEKRIKAIFISHAQEDHIGALPYILKDLNIPIYATKLAVEIIRDLLIDNSFDMENISLNVVDYNKGVQFGDVVVDFFKTTHSIPDAVGISIKTDLGNIVYTSDFNFEQTDNTNYATDYLKIGKIASENVLALLVESIGSTTPIQGGVRQKYFNALEKVFFNARSRIIVSCFSSDLKKIQDVINMSIKYNKRVAIIGRKAQRIVDIAINEKFLEIPKDKLINLKFLSENNKNDDDDVVVIVTGLRHEPFYMLQRMIYKNDRLVHINNTDTVLTLTSFVPGTEKIAAKTYDLLYRTGASVAKMPDKILSSYHATTEEVGIMINLFKPKYVIPVIGEYRHQAYVKKIAKASGYDSDHILFMTNGDVCSFSKDKANISMQDIKVGDLLIDGTPINDNNDVIMRDRETLSEEGIMFLIASVDSKKREVIGDIDMQSMGFLLKKDITLELESKLKSIFKSTISKQLSNSDQKYINWNDIKKNSKNFISNYIYENYKKSPVIITVISAI